MINSPVKKKPTGFVKKLLMPVRDRQKQDEANRNKKIADSKARIKRLEERLAEQKLRYGVFLCFTYLYVCMDVCTWCDAYV